MLGLSFLIAILCVIILDAKCHEAKFQNNECHYAECHGAVCRYSECHGAVCRYSECHYADCGYAVSLLLNVNMLNATMLSVIILCP